MSADSGGALATAERLAAALAAASEGSVRAVLLYGSHLLGATPGRESALDFVVVVSGYRAFYEALHRAGESHRPVWLMAGLSRVLPPNVIAYTPDEGAAGLAKCLVVTREHLLDAVGPRPRDHFLLGRLVQRMALVWSASEEERGWAEARLVEARAGVLAWVGPFLDEPFDAESLGRRLLEVCYRGEVRPEARDRSDVIFEAQRGHFRERLAPVLEAAAREGRLVATGGGYRFATPPGPRARRRWMGHFRRSKVRATLRWFKHIATFENWLPYVHRKAERRLGISIELTRLERRWPVIFLWPRAIRLLLRRPDREGNP
ncbi:MAG: hypothetical protein AMXMBFR53_33150 [Gemmatimonadota bacterium]